MSFAELRYWLGQLLDNPDYGIANVPGGKAALARAMAIAPQGLRSKLNEGWIYPSEQTRMTRTIMRIRMGEMVLKSDPLRSRSAYFVAQDPPKPPVPARREARWSFAPGSRGLSRVPEPTYTPPVPTLQGLFNRDKVRN
jgi:hypothetical protein